MNKPELIKAYREGINIFKLRRFGCICVLLNRQSDVLNHFLSQPISWRTKLKYWDVCLVKWRKPKHEEYWFKRNDRGYEARIHHLEQIIKRLEKCE